MIDPTIGMFWTLAITILYLALGTFLAHILVDDVKNPPYMYLIKAGIVALGYPLVLLSIWALDLWTFD